MEAAQVFCHAQPLWKLKWNETKSLRTEMMFDELEMYHYYRKIWSHSYNTNRSMHMNSRPLSPLTEDGNEFAALTSGHFCNWIGITIITWGWCPITFNQSSKQVSIHPSREFNISGTVGERRFNGLLRLVLAKLVLPKWSFREISAFWSIASFVSNVLSCEFLVNFKQIQPGSKPQTAIKLRNIECNSRRDAWTRRKIIWRHQTQSLRSHQ